MKKESINMRQRIIQAYRQAPWRTQIQSIVMYFLGMVGVLVVAGIYLSVSGQAANAGIQIRELERNKEDLTRQIASMRASLGEKTSSAIMYAKAKDKGFVEPTNEDMVYVVAPGYGGRATFVMAPPPGPSAAPEPVVKPRYRQSLWDWFFEGVFIPIQTTQGARQ
jgi:hypothetical protein